MILDIDAALAELQAGNPVAYPTETLWGLGAPIHDEPAVRRVFQIKKRPLGQPLSVAVATVGDVATVAEWTPLGRRLANLLPGPVTLVLPRRPQTSPLLSSGGPTIGIRVPDHPGAQALLRRAGPLTATSANLHGEAEPSSPEEIHRSLGVGVLDAPPRPRGVGSTIIDATGPRPRILRAGALPAPVVASLLSPA